MRSSLPLSARPPSFSRSWSSKLPQTPLLPTIPSRNPTSPLSQSIRYNSTVPASSQGANGSSPIIKNGSLPSDHSPRDTEENSQARPQPKEPRIRKVHKAINPKVNLRGTQKILKFEDEQVEAEELEGQLKEEEVEFQEQSEDMEEGERKPIQIRWTNGRSREARKTQVSEQMSDSHRRTVEEASPGWKEVSKEEAFEKLELERAKKELLVRAKAREKLKAWREVKIEDGSILEEKVPAFELPAQKNLLDSVVEAQVTGTPPPENNVIEPQITRAKPSPDQSSPHQEPSSANALAHEPVSPAPDQSDATAIDLSASKANLQAQLRAIQTKLRIMDPDWYPLPAEVLDSRSKLVLKRWLVRSHGNLKRVEERMARTGVKRIVPEGERNEMEKMSRDGKRFRAVEGMSTFKDSEMENLREHFGARRSTHEPASEVPVFDPSAASFYHLRLNKKSRKSRKGAKVSRSSKRAVKSVPAPGSTGKDLRNAAVPTRRDSAKSPKSLPHANESMQDREQQKKRGSSESKELLNLEQDVAKKKMKKTASYIFPENARLYSTSARPYAPFATPNIPSSHVQSRNYTTHTDSPPTSNPKDAKPTTSHPEQTALPHLTTSGSAHMVSVSSKPHTVRTAIAVGRVTFSNPHPVSLIRSNSLKKGDVLSVSRIAGIMAAKRCPDLIPLCHPITLTHVGVELRVVRSVEAQAKQEQDHGGVEIQAKVECTGATGVEMEALTAVVGAALTVVDMCKAVDKGMRVEGVRVVLKEGGRSGVWKEEGWVGFEG